MKVASVSLTKLCTECRLVNNNMVDSTVCSINLLCGRGPWPYLQPSMWWRLLIGCYFRHFSYISQSWRRTREKKKQTCTLLTQQWSQSLYFSRSHVYLKTSLKSKKSITQRQGNEARYSSQMIDKHANNQISPIQQKLDIFATTQLFEASQM